MSKLFHSETGRVLFLESEEIARWRHVRKFLRLPPRAHGGGTLYLLAKSRRGIRHPLRVRVNGGLERTIRPNHEYYLSWFALPIDARELRGGLNVVELWADNDAMDGWMLGIEPCARKPDSALSLDGGVTWRTDRMGVHHAIRGEYVVRLRLDDPALSDSAPPAMVWEDPMCERLTTARAAIPARIASIKEPWRRAKALASWLCLRWRWAPDRPSTFQLAEYCPWDPLTILAWRDAGFGQFQANPVAFCVQYGAAYVALALSLGLPARAICGTAGTLERLPGHFIAEVWIEAWKKWCYVDPLCDFTFERDGLPLSTDEISRSSDALLRAWLIRGPAFAKLPDATRPALERTFGGDLCFRQWALWPRNDFLSRPEMTPPSHGATYYCEADWLWAKSPRNEGMFPWHVEADRLAAPPPAKWRAMAKR